MREKPNLPDSAIQDCLLTQYGLPSAQVTFLPRGGDIAAAVYQITAADGTACFLKLRGGTLAEISLSVPKFLADSGIRAVIAPLAAGSGQLWTHLAGFQAVVYPFIDGRSAFEVALTAPQWVAFGESLRAIHHIPLPADLAGRVPSETYSPRWRERVLTLMQRPLVQRPLLLRVEQASNPDPAASQYAGFLREKSAEILHIVQMAGRLAAVLQAQAPPFVLCHSDIHAGNLLVDASGSLHLVDWDFPILAPKERDLMFIGGGVGSAWNAPQEAALFYQGYHRGFGPAQVDPVALAYYRFERIVQDIAEWGERVLLTSEGGEDRGRWLHGLHRWFQPGDVVQMAYQAERLLPPELRS